MRGIKQCLLILGTIISGFDAGALHSTDVAVEEEVSNRTYIAEYSLRKKISDEVISEGCKSIGHETEYSEFEIEVLDEVLLQVSLNPVEYCAKLAGKVAGRPTKRL